MIPLVAYIVLALVVLGPVLVEKYLLTLDMVFTPHLHYPTGLDNLWVFHELGNSLNLLLPGWVIQKLLLVSVFVMAGLGMHRLVPGKEDWARYAAGLLYIVNPFTYSRLMSGQYLVLAGYALLPWFVAAIMRFVRDPAWKTGLRATLWATAIGLVSIHFFGFAALIAAVALAAGLVRAWRRHSSVKALLGWSVAALGGVALLSSFWLVPALTGHSSQSELIGQFDLRHALSFRTNPDPQVGQLINTIGLHGMWTDREALYRSSKSVVWLGLMVVIWGIAVVGAFKTWPRHRLEIAVLGVAAVVGWVLAQGVMGSPFAEVNQYLFDHVPFYAGYREPGKFIGLIALALAYSFGLGVGWLIEHTRAKPWGQFLPPLLLALPLVYTPTMLWGAAGQLKATDYPSDWYELNRNLKGEGKVLFLPWHQYMYFDFAGRLIANPAQRFFDAPVIQGDNAEIGLIERQTNNSTSRAIERDVLSGSRTDVAAKLRGLGIRYVVLAKTADYKDYGWLNSQPGLSLTTDSATLKVYEVKP